MIYLAIFLGIFFGIITGLTPGIHINLISLLLISSSSYLLGYFSLLSLSCFIVAMSVTHTFLDSIPSIYLGAPDSDTCLGVLPGHRYLMNGLGYMAVKLTVIGSFFGLLLSIILFPVLIYVVKFVYPVIKGLIGYILIIVVLFMIFRDKKKIWALTVFLISGFFGFMVLNTYNVVNPLFPLLSGLFGVSTLLFSLNDKVNIPKQRIESKIDIKKRHAFKAICSSTFAGFLTSMFPGLGGAQGAVIAMQFARNIGDHGFMILMGGINTVNFVLSLVTLLVLGKARNGAVIAVQELIPEVSMNHIIVFVLVALIAGSIASILALVFARCFSKLITKVNYRMLVLLIVGFIVVLTYPLSGWMGLLILFTSTFLGFIPAIVKCSRTHAMGCLLLPVISYFI